MHSMANLLQFREKNSRSEKRANIVFSASSICEHRKKKTHLFDWKILLSYAKENAQNKKKLILFEKKILLSCSKEYKQNNKHHMASGVTL